MICQIIFKILQELQNYSVYIASQQIDKIVESF